MRIWNNRSVLSFLIWNYGIGMVSCALSAFSWSCSTLMVVWTIWTWSVLCRGMRVNSWSWLAIVSNLRVVCHFGVGSNWLNLVCGSWNVRFFKKINLFFLQLSHLSLDIWFFTHFYFLDLLSWSCVFLPSKLNFSIRILVYNKVAVSSHYQFLRVNRVVLIENRYLIWRSRKLLSLITMIGNQCILRGSIWVYVNARRGPKYKMKLLLSRWVEDNFLVSWCLSH